MKKMCTFVVFFIALTALSSASTWHYGVVTGLLDGSAGQVDGKTGESVNNAGYFFSANGSMSYSNYAAADYGSLHVASDSSFSLINVTQALAYGFASFRDTLTINSPTLTGQLGQLLVEYSLDGSISGTGVSTNSLVVISRVFGAGGKCGSVSGVQCFQDYYYNDVNGTFVHPFSITFGTPFDLEFDMQASTGTWIYGMQAGSKSGDGSGNVDFSQSLVLSGLNVLDQAGNPLQGVSFASASGTLYTSDGVGQPVPEPTSLLLLGTGLGAIGLGAWRRRK